LILTTDERDPEGHRDGVKGLFSAFLKSICVHPFHIVPEGYLWCELSLLGYLWLIKVEIPKDIGTMKRSKSDLDAIALIQSLDNIERMCYISEHTFYKS